MFSPRYNAQAVQQFLQPFAPHCVLKTHIERLDTDFQKRAGLYLLFNKSAAVRAGSDFSQIHAMDFRQKGRPSLPALALEYIDILSLPKDTPYFSVLMEVTLCAEEDALQQNIPLYHSPHHYADVLAVMANFLHHANKMTTRKKYLGLIAAMGHDLNHPGTRNPTGDIYKNEMASFNRMSPIFNAYGLDGTDIATLDIMLKTTSPNGPHNVLKKLSHAMAKGQSIANWDDIDPEQKFPELKVLRHDDELRELCAMLSDADLFMSAGAGLKAQKIASALLTKEAQNAGNNLDFTSDTARMFFFDNIVSKEGFTSHTGKIFGNSCYFKMRRITTLALK